MQDPMDQVQDTAPAVSLREYGDILRRRRAIIFQVFVLVFVAGVLVTLFQAPTYTSSARLLVEAPNYGIQTFDAANPLNELFRSNRMYSILTQVELLQSSKFRKEVAEKLGGGGNLPFLSVSALEGTQIITVTAEGDNPEMVAAAPNALLDIYVEQVGDSSAAELKKAISFAEQQLTIAQGDLKKYEGALQKFKEKNKVTELAAAREAQMGEVQTLEADYQKTQTAMLSVNAQIEAIRQQMQQQTPTSSGGVSPLSDPAIQGLEAQLVSLEASRAGLKEAFTEKHQEIRAIDKQKEVLQKRLADLNRTLAGRNEKANPIYAALSNQLSQLYVEASGLSAQTATMAERLVGARKRLQSFPDWETQVSRLTRRLETAQSNHKAFQSTLDDLRLREQTRRKNASVLERAEVPTAPIRPQKAQNILFAGILGIFFGLCLALLQEFMDDRINSPDEADRVLRLPNLGYIPMIEEQGLRLIRDIHAFSPIVESYRSLRANINFAAVDNPVRNMLVTSSSAGEGKSTTCANLAMAMALDGKRVIVVDADLRRPSQHKLFNIAASPGLTDILVGTHTIAEALRPTNIDRVSIIPAGSVPPNPAEMLGSEAMAHFIEAIGELCDIVLFDSPPILPVADSVLLATRVDGVLLVVSYGETKKASARQAQELLARARANVLGTVLNKLGGKGGGYYYYYYRGKYYAPVAESGARGELKINGTNGSPNGINGASPHEGDGDTEGALTGAGSASSESGSAAALPGESERKS